MDKKLNFAISLVATAPSPATSGTSLVVTSGEGDLFPQPSTDGQFNVVIFPVGEQPNWSNAEIVRVTARSTDTFTIDRAEEGTSARTIVVGDIIMLPSWSAKDSTDLATALGTIPTTEVMQDLVGAMFTGNTESGITATYQDDDGTIDLTVASQTGRLKDVIILTTGTAQTYTPSSGTNSVTVEGVGGAGGGGGADGGSSQAGVGGGGSAGGYFFKRITSLAASYTYTVGSGGNGGTAGNNSGSDGTDTTFTDGVGLSLVGSHGWGGSSMAAGTTVAFASAAGVLISTGGDINTAGGAGFLGLRLSGTIAGSGSGGSSMFGGGGQGRNTSGVGPSGVGYGAGGAGGMADTTTDRAGGAGTGGIIIIKEYY